MWPSLVSVLGVADVSQAQNIFERAQDKQLVKKTFPKKEVGGKRVVDITFGPAAEKAIKNLPPEPVKPPPPAPKPKPVKLLPTPQSITGARRGTPARYVEIVTERRDKLFLVLCQQVGGEIVSSAGYAVTIIKREAGISIKNEGVLKHLEAMSAWIEVTRGSRGIIRIALTIAGRREAKRRGYVVPPGHDPVAVRPGSLLFTVLVYLVGCKQPQTARDIGKATRVPGATIHALMTRLVTQNLAVVAQRTRPMTYKHSELGQKHVEAFPEAATEVVKRFKRK
jgi:hypothetical protein